jgi:transglutaminase-like putative cysteine protease
VRYRVRHLTTYWYDTSVQMSHNAARLHPRTTDRQRCAAPRVDITPRPAEMGLWAPDYFGNPVLFFRIQQPHRVLTVEVESEVEVAAPPTRLPFETPPWEAVRDRLRRPREEGEFAAAEFLYESALVPHLDVLAAYAAESFLPRRPVLDAVLDLTHRIHADFAYDPAATDVSTPLAQAWEMRRGVCQDFAHLEIAALRAMGIPARYVSGYVLTYPPPGQQRLVGGDASHAWVSAWLPDLGWVDVDPTNDGLVSDEHVTLAWGRDFEDVSPLKGVVLGGGEHAPHVEVDVEPLEGRA